MMIRGAYILLDWHSNPLLGFGARITLYPTYAEATRAAVGAKHLWPAELLPARVVAVEVRAVDGQAQASDGSADDGGGDG